MKRVQRPRNIGIPCPHCGDRMITRTSEQVTPTVRTTRMVCEQCDFSCVAQLSIILTVRSSERPNPEVCLPFSSQTRNVPRLRPANDDAPMPANDDGPTILPAAIGDPMTPS